MREVQFTHTLTKPPQTYSLINSLLATHSRTPSSVFVSVPPQNTHTHTHTHNNSYISHLWLATEDHYTAKVHRDIQQTNILMTLRTIPALSNAFDFKWLADKFNLFELHGDVVQGHSSNQSICWHMGVKQSFVNTVAKVLSFSRMQENNALSAPS